MDPTIQEFIRHKNIAIVGASRQGAKFGNTAAKELQERGYEVFYVHPEASEIDGQATYPNLEAVKEKAQSVWISVSAGQGADVLRAAAEAGLTRVWIQQGADSPRIIKVGSRAGIEIGLWQMYFDVRRASAFVP